MSVLSPEKWVSQVVKQDEIDKYLVNGKDFIDETLIFETIEKNKNPDSKRIRDILQKSLSIQRLEPDETAALLNVEDKSLIEEMEHTALEVKRKVYDNRIVFFAPLYCSNLCVNSCLYCGFRKENRDEKRRILSMDEIRNETKHVIDEGHKRMIVVYGEHPLSDIDYMCDSIKAIYEVKSGAKVGSGNIRRVNVNAAPLSIKNMAKLKEAGIGTYQVFQETYGKERYAQVHPAGLKSNYRWRLYALHRAMEGGVDDMAIGALFGLYNWKFDVMGLLAHTMDLERQFGIGPHTISFPRLNPASGSDLSTNSEYLVNNEQMKKIVTTLRLSVPYTGLIVTARETASMREQLIMCGCTQTDASTKLGIGGYSEKMEDQSKEKQQFLLGDTRSLDDFIYQLAKMDMITSFCTAGYRCGRTGDKIMDLLKTGTEGKFCKLNAVLTYKEYLEDYASERTRKEGERVLQMEMDQIDNGEFFKNHKLDLKLKESYKRIADGERDVFL